MATLESLRSALPEAARDIRLNLETVLGEGSLSPSQRWGVAVTSAATVRHRELLEAVVAAAAPHAGAAVIDDALAAAALMAMNNVYYRFRHMVGKEEYSRRPARLRMNRIARPAASKADFELFCLAASAINGCERCIRSHEETVLAGGLTEEQVHDAVRIAATIHAAAVALETTEAAPAAPTGGLPWQP
ncbi:MAG TPA: carboxymuconolactone decarboxylase family protein [Thermoanaerobaculia bacterium]|nr:carboxymuconolactone decarboxylase family protein [Thermoanaerobaculia bacterium]